MRTVADGVVYEILDVSVELVARLHGGRSCIFPNKRYGCQPNGATDQKEANETTEQIVFDAFAAPEDAGIKHLQAKKDKNERREF